MAADDRHIAIAGGGIAGLTTALSVASSGTRVTVFEQTEQLEEVGAGLQVSPNAWRILDRLSLGEKIGAVSVTPETIRMRRGRDGRTLALVPLGKIAAERWGAPYRVVHRADLQNMLGDAIEANSAAEIRLGMRVSGYRISGSEVLVQFADGTQEAFDGLIGADGIWSSVRDQVTGGGDPVYSGKVAWRATIPASDLPAGINPMETGLWLGRDAHLVHYAVRAGSEINVVAIFADRWNEQNWSAPGRREEVIARYAGWHPLARALVETPESWLKWALADREPISHWGVGPVTLAGDAAHPMLPFLAQGAAMGIEDGYVLGQVLNDQALSASNDIGSDDIATAFRRYENRRMSRTARVQRGARSNGDIYHLGGIAGRARDAALGLMSSERLLSRFDWLYGWGMPADR